MATSAAMSIPGGSDGVPPQRTFLGHPLGLFILFLTELFERFCYYGMRAILILFLTKQFLWSQEDASRVYKWYTALVYLTPLLGGYLADRYLGNKLAVIIGAITMAVGEFMLVAEDLQIFYIGLGLLIIGNGFFKPNMSVQVGRLYQPGDPRRDAAYTIFYMGINAGALMSPLICGTLGELYGFKWGFLAAGIGMLLGLVIYLLGQPFINELPQEAPAKSAGGGSATQVVGDDRPAYPLVSGMIPGFFALLSTLSVVVGVGLWLNGQMSKDNMLFMLLIAGSVAAIAYVMFATRNRDRDRATAICALMIFVIAFWFAFEQAGNVLNVWADSHTDRYILHFGDDAVPATTLPAATQPVPPPAEGMAGKQMPASWFQSVNPTLIVLLAPIFAWFWVWLSKKGREPSTPMKMALGVFLCALSFVVMVAAAQFENQPSQTRLAAMPRTIPLTADGALAESEETEPAAAEGAAPAKPATAEDHKLDAYMGGRLKYDTATQTLSMTGVLPDLERDRILGASVSAEYRAAVKALAEQSTEKAKDGKDFVASVPLAQLPDGFDMRWTTLDDKVRYDETQKALVATRKLAERDEKLLLLAGADPQLRVALYDIFKQTWAFRVSTFWLFLSYLLATMGELCLSPVGLSMVSKLAPQRFATLLMGLWLCNSFFANFLAGFMGELWGKVAPVPFFTIFVGVCGALAVVLTVLARPIKKMMHGVQ